MKKNKINKIDKRKGINEKEYENIEVVCDPNHDKDVKTSNNNNNKNDIDFIINNNNNNSNNRIIIILILLIM